jgi:hypothetical protein
MQLLNYILTMFGKKQPPKIEVIRRESTSLRLDEWRSQPELVAMADVVWRNPDFRLMLQVVQNASPANSPVVLSSIEARAIHQARTEGYHAALFNLSVMRIPNDKIEELEATYEAEEN